MGAGFDIKAISTIVSLSVRTFKRELEKLFSEVKNFLRYFRGSLENDLVNFILEIGQSMEWAGGFR